MDSTHNNLMFLLISPVIYSQDNILFLKAHTNEILIDFEYTFRGLIHQLDFINSYQ